MGPSVAAETSVIVPNGRDQDWTMDERRAGMMYTGFCDSRDSGTDKLGTRRGTNNEIRTTKRLDVANDFSFAWVDVFIGNQRQGEIPFCRS